MFVWRPWQHNNWVVKICMRLHVTLCCWKQSSQQSKKSSRIKVTEGIFPWAFIPCIHKPSCLRKLRWSRTPKITQQRRAGLSWECQVMTCLFSFVSWRWSTDFIQLKPWIPKLYKVFKMEPKWKSATEVSM